MRFNYEKFRDDCYKLSTHSEIAENTGISENVIKNISSGRKVVRGKDDENINKICNYLNLNIDDYWIRNCVKIGMYNFKGGVAKTQNSCSIADVLAKEFNKKVLLFDLDAQANASFNLNMHLINNYDEKNIFQAFMKQEDVSNGYIFNTGYPNIDMVVSHLDLATVENFLVQMNFKEQRFSNIIDKTINSNTYDICIFDLPPQISAFNTIVLRTMDYVIIPVVCDPFSLSGLSTVIDTIKQINDENKMMNNKHRVKILGILISRYEKQLNMSKAINEVYEKLYGSLLFKTKIVKDTSILKAQGNKEMLSVNYSNSNAYKSYIEVTKEILNGIKEK